MTLRPAPFAQRSSAAWWRGSLLEWVALALTIAAIGTLCAISPLTLAVKGIDYDTAGGSALAKIHPGTYLAFAALAVRLCATANPWRTLQRLLLVQPGLLIYLAALGLLAVYVIAVTRSNVKSRSCAQATIASPKSRAPLSPSSLRRLVVGLLSLGGGLFLGLALALLTEHSARSRSTGGGFAGTPREANQAPARRRFGRTSDPWMAASCA